MTPSSQEIHIRILSEYFSSSDASTGKLLAELAGRMLAENFDFRVSIVSGRAPYRQSLGQLPALEVGQGGRLHIVRLAKNGLRKRGAFGRLVSDAQFTLSATLSALASPRADVNIVVTNPWTLPLACIGLRGWRSTPYVYLLHDVYPDVAVANGLLGERHPVTLVLRWLQRSMMRHASAVVVLGECMVEEMQRRYGMPAERLHLIPNWWSPIFEDVQPRRPAAAGLPLRLVYAGNIGVAQEFDTLFSAISPHEADVHLTIIGQGERLAELRARVRHEGRQNVMFLPQMSEFELAAFFESSCDVAVVTLQSRMTGLAVPSKAYNILASGQPLLGVMDPRCEIARVIQRAACGINAAPGDVKGLREAIKMLQDAGVRSRMGLASRRAAAPFSLESAVRSFSVLCRQVAPGEGRT